MKWCVIIGLTSGAALALGSYLYGRYINHDFTVGQV
jgi:hypothetical protein